MLEVTFFWSIFVISIHFHTKSKPMGSFGRFFCQILGDVEERRNMRNKNGVVLYGSVQSDFSPKKKNAVGAHRACQQRASGHLQWRVRVATLNFLFFLFSFFFFCSFFFSPHFKVFFPSLSHMGCEKSDIFAQPLDLL